MLLTDRRDAARAGSSGQLPSWSCAVLVGVGLLGAAFLVPRLAYRAGPGDALLLPLAVIGTALLLRSPDSPVRPTIRAAAPFLWLIMVGSLIGLSDVGLVDWAIDPLAKEIYVLAIFAGGWHLVWSKRDHLETILSLQLVALALMAYYGIKYGHHKLPTVAPHPNMTGSFSAIMSVAVLMASRRRVTMILAVALGLAGVFGSQSFGAAAALAVGIVGFAVRSFRRTRPDLRPLFVAAVPLTLAVAAMGATVAFEAVKVDRGDEILDETSEGRFQIWSDALAAWQDRPQGLGPGGLRARGEARDEAHNDLLGFAVERSLIGLTGLVGFWVILWRSGNAGLGTHTVMFAVLVGGLTHETVHYRHIWVAIAVILVADGTADGSRRG